MKRNISQPPEWWAEFQAQAAKEKLSLSAWLGLAGLARLTIPKRKKLKSRPPANRPKKTQTVT